MFLGFCIIPLLSIKFLRKQNETKNHFNPFQTNTFIIKNRVLISLWQYSCFH
jgi:hypothetical protein